MVGSISQGRSKMSKLTTRFQAAVLSAGLLLPASGAFAASRDERHDQHRHGALAGAAIGAMAARHHRVRGALMGATAGAIIQHHRNHQTG